MSITLDSKLKDTVKSLGKTLGKTIETQLGEEWLHRIEEIRLNGRESFKGNDNATGQLKTLFKELDNDQLLTVARAFTQFLNLANIAEQEFNSHAGSEAEFEHFWKKSKLAPIHLKKPLNCSTSIWYSPLIPLKCRAARLFTNTVNCRNV